ncbi:hypothetical protein [Cupriavidus sp. H18C2]|uniref:hypothetical protein n=1 Tax=Cupriavidus sp. H18C2 TaxID=3241602 RepID=UPI003BF8D4A4
MEVLSHTENARINLLQGLAGKLADMAADALEPYAGLPIENDLRAKLAADVHQALRNHMPTLANVQHALDVFPATA